MRFFHALPVRPAFAQFAAALLMVACGGLAGCATSTPETSSASASTSATLPAEQRRLAALFKGTPVTIELTPDGALRAQEPLAFAFDKNRSVVKPPLAALLDRLVPSANAPGVHVRISAPADSPSNKALAQDRAASARDYLISKGVPVDVFTPFGPPHLDTIELIIDRN